MGKKKRSFKRGFGVMALVKPAVLGTGAGIASDRLSPVQIHSAQGAAVATGVGFVTSPQNRMAGAGVGLLGYIAANVAMKNAGLPTGPNQTPLYN